VASFNPEFSIGDPFDDSNGAGITFGHLLSYSSGLPREAPCDDWGGRCINVTTSQILGRVAKFLLKFPPGTKGEYSNFGFELAGNLLAERLGVDFSTLLQNQLTKPLNLTDTGVDYTPSVLARLAVGYDEEHPNGIPFVDGGWTNPSAGLYSSILDQAKLLLAIDSPTKVFEDPATANLDFLHPQVLNNDGVTGFGLGWQIYRLSDYMVLYKSGALPGYRSVISYIPELRLGFAALMNGGRVELSAPDYMSEVTSLFVPILREHLIKLQGPVMPPNANLLVGKYYGNNST